MKSSLVRQFHCFLLLGLCILVPQYGWTTPSSTQRSLEILSVRQIRRLKPEALRGTLNVRVLGTVTYLDLVGPNLFVQDKTGGIWVDLRGLSGGFPQVGQSVEVTGIAAAGFTPYISKPKWKVLGKAPTPKPVHLTYAQASTGAYDGTWVEMDGVVRSFVQEAEGNVLVIDVVTPTGTFKVRIPGYRAGFPMQLVDANVRFRGVCGAAFNRRNQLVAIHLLMPTLEDIEVLDAPPADPFAIETTAISNILQYSSDLADVHRLKVVGTVTARFPQRGLFLMDATGGVYVETQDGTPANPGDEIEVIGFPSAGSYTPVLKSASLRGTSRHHDIAPVPVTARQALRGRYDAQLIRIDGTVRGHRQHLNTYALVVESDDHITFEASLPTAAGQKWMPPLDSRITTTGVCSIRADENGNPLDFEVVLRSPADIHVIAYPPWLNAQKALFIVGFFVMLTLAITAWVTILRRRIRRQTRVIKLKLQNELALQERYRRIFERNVTGLYVADQAGTIVDCNDVCARTLGFANRADLLQRHTEAEPIIQPFYGDLNCGTQETEITNVEHRFRRIDGSWGWVLSNAKYVRQTGGGIIEGALVDISDRKSAEARIQFLAYYDSLTGLPNRTLLKDRLAKAVATAKRHRDKVAVLFLDLDRFKYINDSLGHSFGDLLLQELSTRLQTWAREQDTVARLGGDEFVVVLSSIKDTADAAIAAERIIKAVTREFVLRGQVLNVTCSIGISMFPDHGEDVETLIKNADAAMYCSKDGGRNTFRFFNSEINVQVSERLQLENSLHTALERQQLFLMYQPEIDVLTGSVTACEALLRWKHPELGMVPPDKFIKIAENSGLIIPIGEWVLRTACAQARQWQTESSAIPVAVNVSAVQFRQDGFADMVKQVLHDTGLDPGLLELELTETLLLSNEDVMFRVLGQLQAMGLRLAIDDFGTGYSSLSYLKQFPVSKLKIDRSFIRDLGQSNDDEAITAAIIHMAKCLNLKVTAEGVETQSQLALLREHACDQVQGFLFSKPVIAEHVNETLARPYIDAPGSVLVTAQSQ
ncbi:MAG TPA: EAL domain-containing protein [Terriglobales bacterium]|nr:EAL domain-containing protein [Terriglobales bacterium]